MGWIGTARSSFGKRGTGATEHLRGDRAPNDRGEQRLSPRLRVIVQRLREHWLSLDGEIAQATDELTAWAAASPLCQRVLTVPGIGPMIATAVIAAVGDARMFSRGRDMAAWLGLVPRQYSTGGKPTLGHISKRGNGYVRQLFLQGAVSAYLWVKRDRSALGAWLDQLDRRRHRQVVITPLANKMVRICWKVLTSEETFPALSRSRRRARRVGPLFACRKIARDTCRDGTTVNRRTVSLTEQLGRA